ncbi:MAG: hypothetical protein Q8K58_01680 [Acidimicrobiales bacterium]|nr:hypothetical protein [Acidimicrobiales bacterium]
MTAQQATADRINEVHERSKDLYWDPSYHVPQRDTATMFKLPKRTKDPFRHLLRLYAPSQQEKDERMYGSVTDALSRVGNRDLQPRWVESLKVSLPILTLLEIGAGRMAAILADSLDNPELRAGNMAQVVDEIRHYNMQMYLQRYWAKHWIDPEPFARGLQLKDKTIGFGPASGLTQLSAVADPIAMSINGQAVAETAYTNVIFTAVTEIAAANGDDVTPTVFLSIQSDEARHMSNGYATLAAVLSEPENLPMLQIQVDAGLRRLGLMLDGWFGTLYDYSATHRTKSYGEIWDEWVWEDFIGTYFGRLEPFGLQMPSTAEAARHHAHTAGHANALFNYGLWPLGIQRLDPPTAADCDWLESKYPGWYATYGAFWETIRDLTRPGNSGLATHALLDFLGDGQLPALCNTCSNACILPTPKESTVRIKQIDGVWLAFCTDFCEFSYVMMKQMAPGMLPAQTFFQRWDGHSLSEVVQAAGLLRADGKTLMGQPHLDLDHLWTLDDLRTADMEIRDPVRLYAERHASATVVP